MKIAIIGTGITGNAAAWLLHPTHDITVYEQNPYIGGHSHTVTAAPYPAVDTGFIVYNEWTYPNLIALFDHLGIVREASDMSFGVSLNDGMTEYAGHNLFVQKRHYFSARFFRMLWDILRFYKCAPDILDNPHYGDMTLGAYLQEKKI